MIDIYDITDDMQLMDSQIPKAKNILSIQTGSLTYNPAFGCDFSYFLTEQFEFQNESFQSYILSRLSYYSIDVLSVVDTFAGFMQQYGIVLKNKPGGGFIV